MKDIILNGEVIGRCVSRVGVNIAAQIGDQASDFPADWTTINTETAFEVVPLDYFPTELTPEGEQFVIPGCAKKAPKENPQLNLFGG